MKKFAKMSLVAAVAVAGMTTANAKDLSEAIKGVDVSGTIVYRYNDYTEDNKGEGLNGSTNYYKLVVNTKAPVNEDVTANTSFAANNNFGGWSTGDDNDENVSLELTKVNFAYTGIKNTTVIVGKQGLPTPWTVASDSDGAEHTGTGALALSTWGPVTFAGAYFNQQNLDQVNAKSENGISLKDHFTGAEDILTVGAMGTLGPVSFDAWYLDLSSEDNTTDVSFDSYTVGAKYGTTLGDVKLGLKARYTSLEFDEQAVANTLNKDTGSADADAENELWYVGLSAKMGIFGGSVLYAETGEDGGIVALDNSAKTAVESWNVSLNGQRDASLIKTNINAQVLPELNVALNFNEIESDYDDGQDKEEVYTQITYKMSKNLMTYVRLGQYENDGEDSDVGRLQVQYSF